MKKIIKMLTIVVNYILLPIIVPVGIVWSVLTIRKYNKQYNSKGGYWTAIKGFVEGMAFGHKMNMMCLNEEITDEEYCEFVDEAIDKVAKVTKMEL